MLNISKFHRQRASSIFLRRSEREGLSNASRVNKNDYLFQNIYNIKKTFWYEGTWDSCVEK